MPPARIDFCLGCTESSLCEGKKKLICTLGLDPNLDPNIQSLGARAGERVRRPACGCPQCGQLLGGTQGAAGPRVARAQAVRRAPQSNIPHHSFPPVDLAGVNGRRWACVGRRLREGLGVGLGQVHQALVHAWLHLLKVAYAPRPPMQEICDPDPE